MVLIVLPEKSLKAKLKKFGFASFDKDVIIHINAIIIAYVSKQLKMGTKKQAGGRIVLPMEYFGASTNEYHDSPCPYTDMRVSADYIRPPMESTFGVGGSANGAVFAISLKDVGTFVEEVAGGRPVDNKKNVIKIMQENVVNFMTQFATSLKNASKKDTHLGANVVESVLKKRPFSGLKVKA